MSLAEPLLGSREVSLKAGAEGRYALGQGLLLVVDGDDDLDALQRG
jgi:hypothetical protein